MCQIIVIRSVYVLTIIVLYRCQFWSVSSGGKQFIELRTAATSNIIKTIFFLFPEICLLVIVYSAC